MTSRLHLPNLLQPLVAAAEAAGRVLAAEFARPDGPRGHGSHADVDGEIEAVLRKELLELLPARWRGEETGLEEGAGGPCCWVVDPNDGTSAFLAGERGSAVSIALLHEGIPVLGVVHSPLSADRWGANQNQAYRACQNQSTEPSAAYQHRAPSMDLMG